VVARFFGCKMDRRKGFGSLRLLRPGRRGDVHEDLRLSVSKHITKTS
jgi:hypothetical protein